MSNTELDLGALRALADVSARMGYKVRLTPAELSSLLAAAEERDALKAEVERLRAELRARGCFEFDAALSPAAQEARDAL